VPGAEMPGKWRAEPMVGYGSSWEGFFSVIGQVTEAVAASNMESG